MAKRIEYTPYFDDDSLANDWVDDITRQAEWELFCNQHDFLYMVGELGKGRKPMLKENAVGYIKDTVVCQMNWLIAHITYNILEKYRQSDIEFSDYPAWLFNGYFELEGDDAVEGHPDPKSEEN